MPRGDGKKSGEPRPHRKRGEAPPQKPHNRLLARVAEWEKTKHPLDEKRKHDGAGNTFQKPGSQRKGKRG